MADAVTFRFSGGEQFLVDLRRWRDRLRAEVHRAAVDEGNAIASIVRSQYPVKTGNLRQHVRVDVEDASPDVILVRVRSTARHSHLYERGTKPRFTTGRHRVSAETEATTALRAHLGLSMRFKIGGSGKRAYRGVMPAHELFVPTAILHRRKFKETVRRIMTSPEPAVGTGTPTLTGSL